MFSILTVSVLVNAFALTSNSYLLEHLPLNFSLAGRWRPPLIQCSQRMADWKQITARIRRARGSKDPVAQLSNLFQKTRDAMVAFELARHLEATGQNADAVSWYNTAAQRFRRADWKSKAVEAIARLGGEVTQIPEAVPAIPIAEAVPPPEPPPSLHQNDAALEVSAPVQPEDSVSSSENSSALIRPPVQANRRRRGRRGGRNHRKDRPVTPSQASASRTGSSPARDISPAPPLGENEPVLPPRVADTRSIPRLPVESAEVSVPALKGRFGDPGLSSRLSLLEMQFRRLLTCPPAKLDHADHAPAGPGVFVLTDEELSTYYYVEACDTLRIAVANVARGGANRRGAPSIKPLLAEHLGIPEARVAKYLSDHCVVRWLQLDEGASHFAHFVVAVLRPVLNE